MNVDLESIAISMPLALAVMAMLGYVFATLRQRKKTGANDASFELQRDLTRSRTAVSELNVVIREARSNLARHYARFGRFERRAARLGTRQDNGDARWHELCREIEGLATPTLQLVSDITNAQERIRCQSNYLLNFSELRIDPLTGLGNRRALEQALAAQLSLLKRHARLFSLAVVDIDDFKALNDQHGHVYGDEALRNLAKLLTDAVRFVDILVRYGGDELVVVMPQTNLAGAGTLGDASSRSSNRCRSRSASAWHPPPPATRRNPLPAGRFCFTTPRAVGKLYAM